MANRFFFCVFSVFFGRNGAIVSAIVEVEGRPCGLAFRRRSEASKEKTNKKIGSCASQRSGALMVLFESQRTPRGRPLDIKKTFLKAMM